MSMKKKEQIFLFKISCGTILIYALALLKAHLSQWELMHDYGFLNKGGLQNLAQEQYVAKLSQIIHFRLSLVWLGMWTAMCLKSGFLVYCMYMHEIKKK